MDLVRIVRTILAVVLAVAVAVMPAAAGALAAAGAPRDASAATQHSAVMPDDCAHHHHAPGDSKGADHGAALAGCVVHCFTYAGTVVPGISPAPKASPLQPLFDTGRVASNIAAPPFRPPRV